MSRGDIRLLLVAGDPSGDLYGSLLIRELRHLFSRLPGRALLRFEVAGGRLMKRTLKQDDSFLCDLASKGVTGFVEPARRLPMFMGLMRRIKDVLARRKPDAVICIDFYGFNRHVMGAAKAAGVPVFYFISPQVWASRPGRVRAIKRLVDRMLVIFPFEESLYRDAGVPVTWVGHPLLDLLPEPARMDGLRGGRHLRIGLLPGSRAGEVRRHLPVFLKATTRILRDFPRAKVSVFAGAQLPEELYRRWLHRWRGLDGGHAKLVRESDYAVRVQQDVVLTSSGTATLENALLGLPMVVIYKLSWPTYFLARALIKVDMIAMANILAGRRVVPELIQHDATPENVARSALAVLEDPRKLRAMREELISLRTKLGGRGAVTRTARIILEELSPAGVQGVRP